MMDDSKRKELIDRMMATDDDRSLSITATLFRRHDSDALYKRYVPTGYPRLDELMGGGLTPGVHYIGAISSLGKSTFCLQMADYMAAHGEEVVYVSLEMKRVDLVAKLVSMYTMRQSAPTYVKPGEKGHYDLTDIEVKRFAKTTTDLTNKERAERNTADDWQRIEDAAAVVEEHGKHIKILEAMTRPLTVDYIEAYLEGYVQKYEKKPVVIVDYLQILAPSDELRAGTDKQAMDYNVAKFRMMATKFDTPIVVISSFNRASYDESVSMRDFKESGSIEYSGDSVIGLQLHGVGTSNFNANDAKNKPKRDIDLVLLKQRYGPAGKDIEYLFIPAYNYFDELPEAESSAPAAPRVR